LLTHLHHLVSGRAVAWLADLALESGTGQNNRWSPEDWDELRRKRGRIIAWAAKEGCMRAWLTFTSTLPHENLTPNNVDPRVIVGLTGLQAVVVASKFNYLELTEQDARRAVHYGVNELNGFPPWLSDLARSRPATVTAVLCECIEGEWNFPVNGKNIHQVMHKLVWTEMELSDLVTDKVWELIQISDPPHPIIHQLAATILIRSKRISKSSLVEVAHARMKNCPIKNHAFVLWAILLLQLNADMALDVLEEIGDAPGGLDNVVVGICAILGGRLPDNTTLIENPNYREPRNLRRFIPMVYRHVREAEDLHHEGGYSPTPRDNEQYFRESLLGLLVKSETSESTECLRNLLNHPTLTHLREWIDHLLHERLKRMADHPSWQPSDLRTFQGEHETEPKTDRELFVIGRKRLVEIKLDVEKAENSLRSELHQDYDEAELRKWLHRKLRERSRKRYNVPEEVEIDLEQRPDIRIENPKTNSVSIEVKWAGNWTFPKLVEGLEKQLIDQYLRAHNAHYGIYILGMIGSKNSWEDPENGPNMDFDTLVNKLQRRARELAISNSKVYDIEVISIDFRHPKQGKSTPRPRAGIS